MKYGLDDRPGPGPLMLYGLQWWVVSLPCIVIMGVVAGRLHYDDLGRQTFYLQKLFGLTGLALLAQLFLGHRLPLVVGPATILLVGLAASLADDLNAVYTAIMAAGAALALAAATGLLAKLRFFFTPRIVAVVLVLIAFTLTPAILNLALSAGVRPAGHLAFVLALALALILLNRVLPGVWKSLTVLIGLAGGTLAYFLWAGPPEPAVLTGLDRGSLFLPEFKFQAGPIAAFLFCMTALAINELGSIESVGHMLRADDLSGRVRRGAAVQGLANLASGAMGVIGPVSFSLSAGLIAGTGCASRHTLVPAGLGLLACAFFPSAVLVFARLPEAVMAALLLYLMAGQLASGLNLLVAEKGVAGFNDGLTVGLPLMVGLLVSFAPAAAFAEVPALARPVAANGFVMGALTAVLLEHVVFRRK